MSAAPLLLLGVLLFASSSTPAKPEPLPKPLPKPPPKPSVVKLVPNTPPAGGAVPGSKPAGAVAPVSSSRAPGVKAPAPILTVTSPKLVNLTKAQQAELDARNAAKRAAAAKKATPAKVAPKAKAKATAPAGTIKASPALEPRHGSTPAGYDSGKARAQARGIAAHLAKKGPAGYSRDMLKTWQRQAALTPDGVYGGSSRGALIFYGVANPPRPFAQPVATLPYVPPEQRK